MTRRRAPEATGYAASLAEMPLFRGLTATQLSNLESLMHRKTFPAGTEIITADQPGEIAYVILEGSVKVCAERPRGVEVILVILGPGEIVGEMSLADSLGRSASVVTIEESTLLWMDRATFWTSLRELPTMTYNLVGILSRRLRLANVHAQSLASLDVYGRVASQLLAFAQEYGQAAPDGGTLIPFRLTQGDLASLVGASRVRVNQALSYFRKHNYISVDRNHLTVIHDPDALARRCR
jgi:CRP/FNR family transcriptional regulator, cyclic AMP receptor protein